MVVTCEWCPLKDLQHLEFSLGHYALLILNRKILIPPKTMTDIWNKALFRCTVDGGTENWLSYLKETKLDLKTKLPNVISGDFDSISPKILEYYRQKGVDIILTPNVDKTDFTKALEVVARSCNEKLDTIAVVVETSGRLDHIFSNLNTLYKIQEIFQDSKIKGYLLSGDSVTWLLRPGYHKIHIPERLRPPNSTWCGILPFASKKSTVTTTGLKWNLIGSSIEFGGLISSSNTFNDEPWVTIETDTETIWCMGLGEKINKTKGRESAPSVYKL